MWDDIVQSWRSAMRSRAKKFAPRAMVWARAAKYAASSSGALDRGVAAELGRRCGWSVHSGPFVGLRIPRRFAGNVVLAPKLIGCFESELHAAIERAIERRHATILNIGCAEGYYAVGFALRLPTTRIVAYEADPVMRALCRDLAARNAVSARVELLGTCDVQSLAQQDLAGAFLLCDVEGAEHALLDPERVPGLRHCDLLVECHDGVSAGVTDEIIARFASSHTARRIEIARDPERGAAVLAACALPSEQWAMATSEFRQLSSGWLELLRRQ